MLARSGDGRRRPRGSAATANSPKRKPGGQNPARRSAPSRQRIKCTAEILERAHGRDPHHAGAIRRWSTSTPWLGGHGQFAKKKTRRPENPARRSAPSRQRIKCTAEILERAHGRDPHHAGAIRRWSTSTPWLGGHGQFAKKKTRRPESSAALGAVPPTDKVHG